MSLIDDALKRAQAADGEKKPDGGKERPWTPPPLPDPRRRPGAAVILAIAIAGSALAAVVFFALRSAPHRLAARPAASSSGSASSDLPPITSEVTVAPPPRGLAGAQAPGQSVREERTTVSREVSAAPAPRPSAAAAVPRAPRVDAAAAPPKTHAVREPPSFVTEMTLPGGGKITLDGIVFTENNPVAVLNGKVLPPGGVVDGFTVTKILPDRVELDGEGGKVVLTVR